MYKIMLADDEGIVIDSLKFIIGKEFGDECEVEYAKSGRSVIELAERVHPDIAIMDIQMPGINGIEAIGEIKKHDPDIIFIIVTAYDKFIYAKEAVSLGVFEYLNKPIVRSEIIRVLKEAMEKINRDRQKRSRELMIREKMESVVPILENGFVYSILFHENSPDDVENFRNILNIRENYGLMGVLECDETLNGSRQADPVDSSVRMQKGYQRIRESLKRYLNCLIGSAMGSKVVMVLPYPEAKMDYEDRIELMRNAEAMLKAMNEEHETSFRISFGTVQKLEELPESYHDAIRVLADTDDRVVHADDFPTEKNYDDDYPIEIENEMFLAIDKKDLSLTVQKGNEFFDWMEQYHADDPDDIRLKSIEFVIRAESALFHSQGGVYSFQSRRNYLSDVLNMTELSQIRYWMLDKITEACKKAGANQSSHSENAVGRACRYIQEHFSDGDISLDEVSREVDISPYYFSKLFKEETGKNFIDYLTGIRMDKARELLSSTDCSMKEICAAVGYSDPNYFSRTFKKNVGMTPTEYKEERGQK